MCEALDDIPELVLPELSHAPEYTSLATVDRPLIGYVASERACEYTTEMRKQIHIDPLKLTKYRDRFPEDPTDAESELERAIGEVLTDIESTIQLSNIGIEDIDMAVVEPLQEDKPQDDTFAAQCLDDQEAEKGLTDAITDIIEEIDLSSSLASDIVEFPENEVTSGYVDDTKHQIPFNEWEKNQNVTSISISQADVEQTIDEVLEEIKLSETLALDLSQPLGSEYQPESEETLKIEPLEMINVDSGDIEAALMEAIEDVDLKPDEEDNDQSIPIESEIIELSKNLAQEVIDAAIQEMECISVGKMKDVIEVQAKLEPEADVSNSITPEIEDTSRVPLEIQDTTVKPKDVSLLEQKQVSEDLILMATRMQQLKKALSCEMAAKEKQNMVAPAAPLEVVESIQDGEEMIERNQAHETKMKIFEDMSSLGEQCQNTLKINKAEHLFGLSQQERTLSSTLDRPKPDEEIHQESVPVLVEEVRTEAPILLTDIPTKISDGEPTKEPTEQISTAKLQGVEPTTKAEEPAQDTLTTEILQLTTQDGEAILFRPTEEKPKEV